MPKTSHDIYNARKVSDQFRSGIGINMHIEATGSRSGRHSLMVPVPLPPADVKANSVMSCFFPSSSQQLQDLKFQALSTKRNYKQMLFKPFIQRSPV